MTTNIKIEGSGVYYIEPDVFENDRYWVHLRSRINVS